MNPARRAGERRAASGFFAKAEQFREQNVEAAKILLADVEKHGGEAAGVIVWARLILRHEAERAAAR